MLAIGAFLWSEEFEDEDEDEDEKEKEGGNPWQRLMIFEGAVSWGL
jgi:hypothetical protein